MVLSLLSKKYDFHFTYLGTGCIFQFDENHPFGEEKDGFDESSLPNFFGSSYSIVKGFTDQLMHLVEDSVLNVRIRMPITDEFNKRNFITKITNYAKVCSVPNSMTVLNELIPIMIDMSCKKITGSVNLTNPGLISHNEILEMYKEIVDPEFTWNNFTIDEQNEILGFIHYYFERILGWYGNYPDEITLWGNLSSKEEKNNMHSNIFSISPKLVISDKRFSRLNSWLQQKDILVEEINYSEISKMGGLFRCSTLPLIRE